MLIVHSFSLLPYLEHNKQCLLSGDASPPPILTFIYHKGFQTFCAASTEYLPFVNDRGFPSLRLPKDQARFGWQIKIASWNLCLGLTNKKDYVSQMILNVKIDVCYPSIFAFLSVSFLLIE